MKKYDTLLLGEYYLYNLLNKISLYIEEDKKYLLSFKEFYKRYVNNELSHREDQKLFKVFHDKKNPQTEVFHRETKKKLKQYCDITNYEFNFEKVYLNEIIPKLEKEEPIIYDFDLVKVTYPIIYNVWLDVIYEYIVSKKLQPILKEYSSLLKQFMNNYFNTYSTEFDYFLDDELNTKHIHGVALRDLKNMMKGMIDKENLVYRCIWSTNGLGKQEYIRNYQKNPYLSNLFDYEFLFEERNYGNILIYGLDIVDIGYKLDNVQRVSNEHILSRLQYIQQNKLCDKITWIYTNEQEVDFIKNITMLYDLNIDFVLTM